MNANGNGNMTKLVILGLGAVLLYSQFGPMGLIAMGVIMLLVK